MHFPIITNASNPTLLDPLPTESALSSQVDADLWRELVREPIGRAIQSRFADDTVRGLVAADALLGTFADLDDPSLIQNRCLLYHLMGNGTGEWKVPVNGMGAVTDALLKSAVEAGAEVLAGGFVLGIGGQVAEAAGVFLGLEQLLGGAFGYGELEEAA